MTEAPMTQVDFYILRVDEQEDAGRFPCRLTDKAYHSGLTIFIQTRSEKEAGQLDDLLWTFEQGSFLPHAKISDAEKSEEPLSPPILLGTHFPQNCRCEVFINLSAHPVPNPGQFQRIAEIVYNNEETKSAARQRFRHYKQLGFKIKSHDI